MQSIIMPNIKYENLYHGITSKLYRRAIAFIWLCAISTLAWCGELAGLWQEYNDDTGNVDALIRIEKVADNTYEGKIEKIFFNSVEDSALVCAHCSGNLHNHPLVGLRILSGMRRKDNLNYEGGEILDPDDGGIYRCHIQLSEDGNAIKVTGYTKVNWIGQSEIWRRTK